MSYLLKAQNVVEQLEKFIEVHQEAVDEDGRKLLNRQFMRSANGFMDDVQALADGEETEDVVKMSWKDVSKYKQKFDKAGLQNPKMPSMQGQHGSSRNPIVLSVIQALENALVTTLTTLAEEMPIISDIGVRTVAGKKVTRTLEADAHRIAGTYGTRIEELLNGKHEVMRLTSSKEQLMNGEIIYERISNDSQTEAEEVTAEE